VRLRLEAMSAIGDGASETDMVFRHRLGLSPEQRIRHGLGEVGPRALAVVEEAVAAREKGLPLAYALGRAEFAGQTFVLTQDVLIPRYETEFLFSRADEFFTEWKHRKPTLLDLGCGSGCIGLSLALRHQHLLVTLTDISRDALAVARENAHRLGVAERCRFKTGDWFAAVRRRERFDAVVCNPPYVTSQNDPQLDPQVKRHEPGLALFLEQDPEEFYFRLARGAVSHLVSGGLFAVEVGYDTAWPARCAFTKIKALERGHEVHDFNGLERVIWGIRK